jgi:uncharacterized repeat protein (TIGR01451 family)
MTNYLILKTIQNMLKNKFLLIACLILGLMPSLFAQNIAPVIEWQKCIGGTSYEGINYTALTSDGGYIFVGESNSEDGDLSGLVHDDRDIWVVKMSASKEIEWQKRFGGTEFETPCSIVQATDGGYTLLAYTPSNDGDVSGNHGLNDVWIVKLSSIGAIQWQKCLGGTNYELAYDLIKTSDGGYAVLGRTESNDGDVNGQHGLADGWVVKLSSSGAIQWQKCLGGSNEERLLSINQTKDGGFIISGYTSSIDGDVSGNHGKNDAWIIKLSALGAIEWQKCLGGSEEEFILSVIQTSDGGYVGTGSSNSNDGDVSGGRLGYANVWVVKLSSLGVIQWQKNFGGFLDDKGQSIIQTSDAGYILAAVTGSNDGDVTNPRGGYTDAWIVKLNAQGVLQWQKSLGGTADDFLSRIVALPDGGYLASGYTSSNDFDVTNNHGRSDAWLVKLSPDAKVIKGQVQQTNTFCQPLTPPQYIANAQVKIEKDNTIYFTSTDSLGRFGAFVDTGRFNIAVIPPNQLWTSCPPRTVTISNPNIRDTTIVNTSLFINSICPLINVQLTTPFLRRCFESTYTINYVNRGTAIQNDATAELTLDSALTFVSATRPVRSRVGNKVIFSLGNVGINQTGQFTVDVKVSCDSRLGQTHCSSVIIPKTMTCDTVQDSIPTIVSQCVAGCDSISFLVNKPNTTLNKTFKYQLIADATLIDTGRFVLTNTFNLKRKGDGRTYRLEVRNPTTNQLLAARSVESNPSVSTPSVSTGFVNQFASAVKQSNISENCTANRGAFDPNDKAAVPTGVGAARLIEQGKEIEYLVQFQNTGTDTAFTVVVKDTFSAHFNLSTFKLNATSHVATWQLNPKGILIVTFNNINLVDSFTNEKKSHGFFKYTIKLNDSIVTNTIVTNRAGIYFDFNDPIITNLTSHTIGKELLKNCLIKPTIAVNYSGCPSRNIVFTAVAKSAGLTPTYAWFRNNETTPLSTNAVFTLNNAVKDTKIYCKTTVSSDICTETPVVTSDTIVLNCIGVPTTDLSSIVQLFDVYPNPNKGIFTIKLNTIKSEKIQLNILNYLGQTIKSSLINSTHYAEEFNLSTMPNGIYLIQLMINGQSISKKISVQ